MRSWKHGPLELPRAPSGRNEIALTLRFITPVFGGGVDPKKPDLITPVRASAIRGQLRFWWRATSPLASVHELRQAETQLFGGVHGGSPAASRLEVAVTRQPPPPREKTVYEDGNGFRTERGVGKGLAYGAFPLRATGGPLRHDRLFEYRDDFDVHLRFPQTAKADVTRALGAFLHFGGLGGRTRRGFGAVELVRATSFDLPDDPSSIGRGRADAPWPTLGALASSRSEGTAERMHELALRQLFDMRQGPGTGRTERHPTPGRSLWPEPDAIRALYRGTVRGRHTERRFDIDKFPRAAFGAPIIFHFKRDRGEVEPPHTTLVPRDASRLASPLLLRPTQDRRSGQYRALAVRLEQPVDAWVLKERDWIRASVDVDLTPAEVAKLTPLCGRSDPIDAYFERLRNA